jgi:DNA invertase Pin-like site-specific DNA recombinase
MGRLTLNVLLSFAQFEREVTGERIRDELLADFTNRGIKRFFVSVDSTAGKIPHVRKWDRSAATVVAQLHQDGAIGPTQYDSRANRFERILLRFHDMSLDARRRLRFAINQGLARPWSRYLSPATLGIFTTTSMTSVTARKLLVSPGSTTTISPAPQSRPIMRA